LVAVILNNENLNYDTGARMLKATLYETHSTQQNKHLNLDPHDRFCRIATFNSNFDQGSLTRLQIKMKKLNFDPSPGMPECSQGRRRARRFGGWDGPR